MLIKGRASLNGLHILWDTATVDHFTAHVTTQAHINLQVSVTEFTSPLYLLPYEVGEIGSQCL